MVSGDVGGEPPESVAAVAARWLDHLQQLLEVKFGNGVQLLRQTKGAATDMPNLLRPRHIPTLPY